MGNPKWMSETPTEAKRNSYRKQEKTSAKRYGGKETSGSGNGRFRKADVTLPEYKVECKRTDNSSIVLKRGWIEKIENQAYVERKEPAIEIQLQDKTMVMITQAEFEFFLELRRKHCGH